MKVKVLYHDGQDDWTVTAVEQIEVNTFSVKALMKTMSQEWKPSPYQVVKIHSDVISVMDEEYGYSFVRMD